MLSLFAAVSMHCLGRKTCLGITYHCPTATCEEVRVKTAQYGFGRRDLEIKKMPKNSSNPKLKFKGASKWSLLMRNVLLYLWGNWMH